MWNKRITIKPGDRRIPPDRRDPVPVTGKHFVTGTPITPPFPGGMESVYFSMGCFWGAEREFWISDGVYTTAVGYAGGATTNPSYDDVCSGRTGHAETVLVVFDPDAVSFPGLLKRFWEAHDPTQGMRQGPDTGSQYRSAVFTTTGAQLSQALASRDAYAADLGEAGFGEITTEIAPTEHFFYAEEYHQQYLAKNLARSGVDIQEFYFGNPPPPVHPIAAEGYCGMEPTGVSCPIGLGVTTETDPAG